MEKTMTWKLGLEGILRENYQLMVPVSLYKLGIGCTNKPQNHIGT